MDTPRTTIIAPKLIREGAALARLCRLQGIRFRLTKLFANKHYRERLVRTVAKHCSSNTQRLTIDLKNRIDLAEDEGEGAPIQPKM